MHCPEESATLSLRVQQVIAYETGVCDTVDPLAGSYYVEALTNQIEREAAEYIRKIDEMGGAPAAIEKGYIQDEIEAAAYRCQREIESGERIIVGVNMLQVEEEPAKNLLKVDPRVREVQVRRLRELRATRDESRVRRALEELRKAANDTDNLMYPILDAVRAYATLGEICGVLREVFGECRPSR